MNRNRKVTAKQYELDIIDYSDECYGIAKYNDKTIFVRGALKGEKVLAARYKNNRNYEEADTLEVLKKSKDRITAKCKFYGVCGGCSLQHISNNKQIHLKLTLVKAMFLKNDIEVEKWLDPLTNDGWGYRHKARLGVKFVTKKNKVIVGFRERKSAFLADMNACEVLHPKIGKKLHILAECVAKLSIKYKVAQFEVAISETDTVLVLRNLEELTLEDKNILRTYADKLDIKWQLQSGGINTIKDLDATPKLTYSHPDHNIIMNFLAIDFTQINFSINQKMVNLALKLLDLNTQDNVLDLFCGLGNFTLPIAKYCKKVVGIEGDSGLIERAKRNMLTNGINNAEFYKADLFEDVSGFNWVRNQKYNKALIDPARSGALEVIKLLSKLGVEKLVYISCNPATLMRDSKALNDLGYQIKNATVINMFAQTSHVESIVYFEKKLSTKSQKSK